MEFEPNPPNHGSPAQGGGRAWRMGCSIEFVEFVQIPDNLHSSPGHVGPCKGGGRGARSVGAGGMGVGMWVGASGLLGFSATKELVSVKFR